MKMINVSEVSKLFHVDEETIRRWARAGKIPTKKYGRKWLFNYATITGEQSETDAKELLGRTAIRQKPHYSFDILFDNKRIEVKSASLRYYKKRLYSWMFTDVGIDKNDFYLFMCYDDKHQNLLRSYFIDSKKVKMLKNKKMFSFYISVNDVSLNKYRVFKLNFIKGGEYHA